MAKIHRVSDKIKVQIEDIQIIVSPLTKDQKSNLMNFMIKAQKGDMSSAQSAVEMAMKYSIKGLNGVFDEDDQPYALSFENGLLSDDCLNDLLNMEVAGKVQAVCIALLNNVPSVFKDAEGKEIEGVKIIKKGETVEGK